MAKSTSSAPIYSGSTPPQMPAKRAAAPERWDKPFSADMGEAEVDRLLAHPLFISTQPSRFPASIDRKSTRLNSSHRP